MTQFKGTPGPWTGKDVGIAKQDDAGLQLGFIMTFDEKRRDECAANARLIAAAPELLEALIKCADTLEEVSYQAWCGEIIDEARAAIAKVTGETK